MQTFISEITTCLVITGLACLAGELYGRFALPLSKAVYVCNLLIINALPPPPHPPHPRKSLTIWELGKNNLAHFGCLKLSGSKRTIFALSFCQAV